MVTTGCVSVLVQTKVLDVHTSPIPIQCSAALYMYVLIFGLTQKVLSTVGQLCGMIVMWCTGHAIPQGVVEQVIVTLVFTIVYGF